MRQASKHKKETNNSDSQNNVSSQELITESIKKENKFKIKKNNRTEMKNNCVTLGQNLFNFLIFEAIFLCFVGEKNYFKN